MSEVSADRPLLADLQEDLAALGGELPNWPPRVGIGPAGGGRRLAGGKTAGGRLADRRRSRAGRCCRCWRSRWPTAWRAKGTSTPSIWLLIFAGGLLLLAAASGYFAWRRFRQRIVGFSETLEELRKTSPGCERWLQSGRYRDLEI